MSAVFSVEQASGDARIARQQIDPVVHALLVSFFARRMGQPLPVLACPGLDLEWMVFCADHYQGAVHRPHDPATVKAYAAFTRETFEQFLLFEHAGYAIEFWPGLGEPYLSSAAMRHDVRARRHLWVYRTGDDFPGDHPLAVPSPIPGWLANDCFRVVHDLIGHAWRGFGFSALGEEAACRAHALHYSAEALPALVCETRLQNAWIYFGPHRRNPENQLFSQTPGWLAPLRFPEQKAFAAPTTCVDFHAWRGEHATHGNDTRKEERKNHHGL